jgi:hypothetical protein
MTVAPPELVEYYQAGKPLVCELDASPYLCEFWPLDELATYNTDYEVPENAPDYFAFGTSGGGEMFCISPGGTIVCLAFVGMSPKDELFVAAKWTEFERMLRNAP